MRLRFLLAIFAVTCLSTVSAQERPDTTPTGARPALIREMSGTWRVEQRMWTGAGTQPLALPPAIARRRLVEGGFVEEIMEKLPQAEGDTFTRIAYLNFNALTGQFEYVSLDSRLPQMMTERSRAPDPGSDGKRTGTIVFVGDMFVAPQWGDAKNVAFTYWRTIGPVEMDRQLVQLYLTPIRGERSVEFLAFEYIYTRTPR
jgi:hypothetical protein